MLLSMNDIKHGVEVVHKTVINLDVAPVPTVFVIEPAGSLKDAVVDQLKEGDVEAAEEEVMGMPTEGDNSQGGVAAALPRCA